MPAAAVACPSCAAPMRRQRFPRQLHGEVELDLCFACHGIWFDEFESLQLAPGGIVALFKLIHEHRDAQRLPLADVLRCPHCRERLLQAMDRVTSGPFTYHRCLQRHGRFTSFAQFMIEKGFVRQLSGAEIDALKARIAVVRCTGCGAPVDIRRDSACSHCRAPLAILDPDAVEQALATYHQAEIKRSTRDPAALAEGILQIERQKSQYQRSEREATGSGAGDLVVAGVELALNLLAR